MYIISYDLKKISVGKLKKSNFFRSSTPILNRGNEEPTKAPTIDLFDMLNTSDYREEKYMHNYISNLFQSL